jgi:hypothetical protein
MTSCASGVRQEEFVREASIVLGADERAPPQGDKDALKDAEKGRWRIKPTSLGAGRLFGPRRMQSICATSPFPSSQQTRPSFAIPARMLRLGERSQVGWVNRCRHLSETRTAWLHPLQRSDPLRVSPA